MQPGEVVVVATPNGYEQLLLCLAASRAGALPAPVNALMRPDEIAHVESDSDAALTLQAVSDLPPARGARATPSPAEPDDVAALFYTSGTTGKPKGVELTHKGLLSGVMAGTLLPGGIRHDTAVVSLPMAHIMGFAVALGMACAGVPVWFLPRFNPVRVLDAIESRRASLFVGVPAMYRMLLEAGAEERDLKSVRVWVSGADAMPAELAARFKKLGATAVLPVVGAVGEAAFAEGYGMVETGGGVAAKLSPPMFGRGLGSSMGMPLPGYSFRVVDEDGEEVRRGEVGELLVKGPGVTTGYRGDADATAATFTDDGWLRTGDLARLGPAQRRVLRRPQEGRDQARRLLGVRGRDRAGARAAPRRGRGGGRRPARRAQGRGAGRGRAADRRGDARRGGHEGLGRRAAQPTTRRRSASSPSTSSPTPAPTRSSARSCSSSSTQQRSASKSVALASASQIGQGSVVVASDVAGVSGSVVVVVVVVRSAALRSTSSWPSSTRTG